MRELAALATDLGTTDRTLRRAIAEGLIHAERPTPRTVELTQRGRAYLLRYWNRLAQLRSVLRTEPNVETAILFGSVARGTDHLAPTRRGARPHSKACLGLTSVSYRAQRINKGSWPVRVKSIENVTEERP